MLECSQKSNQIKGGCPPPCALHVSHAPARRCEEIVSIDRRRTQLVILPNRSSGGSRDSVLRSSSFSDFRVCYFYAGGCLVVALLVICSSGLPFPFYAGPFFFFFLAVLRALCAQAGARGMVVRVAQIRLQKVTRVVSRDGTNTHAHVTRRWAPRPAPNVHPTAGDLLARPVIAGLAVPVTQESPAMGPVHVRPVGRNRVANAPSVRQAMP